MRCMAVLLVLVAIMGPAMADEPAADFLELEEQRVELLKGALHNASNSTREIAAAELRRLVMGYPSRTTNFREADAGRARLARILAGVRLDMTNQELLALFPESSGGGLAVTGGGFAASGGVVYSRYRLDTHWMLAVWFRSSDRILTKQPELEASEESIRVLVPDNYSGPWNSYFVNGQLEHQQEFREGKAIGTDILYYTDGRKRTETQLNALGEPIGQSTQWDETGNVTSIIRYEKGKTSGQTLFFPSGKKHHETEFLDGNPSKTTTWNEDGSVAEVRVWNKNQ